LHCMSYALKPESRALLAQFKADRPHGDLWVFAYASLIWKPECEHAETRHALVRGWHRSLCMKSTINRGTPAIPGLVFALDRGGSCQGMALRISQRCANSELNRLWHREMINAVYTPRWVRCQTAEGSVTALTFTLSRSHPSYLSEINDAQYLKTFRLASGRYGSTWDYVCRTHEALRRAGIHDAQITRLVCLGTEHGL
jgi:glutathione-specific gamma-glutamylcyclotransferase